MIANINTVALQGINIVNVNVQIHMANGVPAFNIVGLPDKTVAESRERIRAALNSINPNYGLAIGYNIKKRNRKSASYTITNPCITESLLIPIAGRKVLNISNLQISEVKMILCYSN